MKISSRFKLVIVIIIITVSFLSFCTVTQFLDLSRRLLEIKSNSLLMNNIRDMEVIFQNLVINALDISHTGDISEKRIVAVKLSFTELERKLGKIKEHEAESDNIKKIISLSETLIEISRNSILQPVFNRKEINPDINEKIIYEILDPLRISIKNENKKVDEKMNHNYEEAEILRNRYVKILIPFIAVSFILLCFYLYRVLKKGIGALNVLQKNLENLTGNEVSLDARLNEAGSDETAELGKSFNSFIKRLSEMISELEIIAERHSETGHDLSSSVSDVADSLENVENELLHIVSMNRDLSRGIDKAGADVAVIKQGIDDLSENSESMKKSFNATGKILMESVNKQKILISESELLINTSDKLKRISDAGNISLSAMTEKISNIENRIKRITDTLDVSNDITEKLGVIVINTSIEAAHAGEKGKRFEIIAKEFRKLSTQLNKYNDDTSELMNNMIDDVNDLNEKSSMSLKYLKEILEINNKLLAVFNNNKSLLMESSEMSEKSIRNFSCLDDEVINVDNQISIMHEKVNLIKDQFDLTGTTYSKQALSVDRISNSIDLMNNFTKTVISTEKANRVTLKDLNSQIGKFRNNGQSNEFPDNSDALSRIIES